MSNADQVADSHSPISVAEFARRQLAVVERQMLSATDLADLVELHIVQTFAIFGKKDKAIDLCISRFDEDTKSAFLDLYSKVDAGMDAEQAGEEMPL